MRELPFFVRYLLILSFCIYKFPCYPHFYPILLHNKPKLGNIYKILDETIKKNHWCWFDKRLFCSSNSSSTSCNVMHLLFFLPRVLLAGEHALHKTIGVSSLVLYYTMVSPTILRTSAPKA